MRNLPLMADYVNTPLLAHGWPEPPVRRWSQDALFPSLAPVPRMTAEELDFAVRVGGLIQRERLAQDMSQEMLAEAAGVSVSTIGRWERGENAPKTYQAGRVIAALGIDPMLFLDPPDTMSDLDRLMARKVGEGFRAAQRPRRRATRRSADEHGEPPAPRQ